MISCIVPVLDEEKNLAEKKDLYQELAERTELIFVDGGSRDATRDAARKTNGRVMTAPKGRAHQMNRGAYSSSGDILLFLHADCWLDPGSLSAVREAVYEGGYAGGCFTHRIEHPGFVFRFIEWTGNIRARISGIFYGDQAIFVTRKAFSAAGGFPEVKICEDVEFTRRLREHGRLTVLGCPVYSSARRWREQGVLRTFLFNARINCRLLTGRPVRDLAEQYLDVR